ncbi:hypothetical protein [Wolbachia endosymbiont of Phyllotreta cruciferae]|uniref:hypothetical protein n=1 Tax=Wolbachia endosymbiont of Phyllotreta cruciferae TaxID=2886377 RepID=UPI00209EEE4D|nr:hypothetical protein [Wolbachia endosymbiont of Phyllotreta cruciferae]
MKCHQYKKTLLINADGTKHMESVLLSDDNFSVYIRNLMRAIENCTKIYQTTKTFITSQFISVQMQQ